MAADQEYAPGQFHLGRMYIDGIGTPKDDLLAIKYYLLSAETPRCSMFFRTLL